MFDIFNNTGNFVIAATTLPFLIIALIFVVVIFRNRRKAKIAQGWSVAVGRVLMTQIVPRTSTTGSGGRSTAYYPVVMYQYQVDGVSYQGDRVSFGMAMGSGSPRMAQKWIEKYQAGDQVDVYYNPAKPEESVLEPRTSGSNRVLWFVVILILAILAFTTFISAGIGGGLNNLLNNLPR